MSKREDYRFKGTLHPVISFRPVIEGRVSGF